MYKKRLEDALNAAKLIRLGFSLNYSKPEKIDLLYKVNVSNYDVTYCNEEFNKNQIKKEKEKKVIDSDEDIDQAYSSDLELDKNIKKSNLNNIEYEERIEVLCLKFNEAANLIAVGDSNGQIKVKKFIIKKK